MVASKDQIDWKCIQGNILFNRNIVDIGLGDYTSVHLCQNHETVNLRFMHITECKLYLNC